MAKVTRLTLDSSGELDRRRLQLREVNGDADAPLESVGQDLRRAREKRGEDLEQISRALKIRQDYLAAIEDSNQEALPGRTYAIGFVRSYAAYLGLDAREFVERLKAEIAGRSESKETLTTTVISPVDRKFPHGGVIVAGLLAAAVIYSGYYLVVSATRMPPQTVTPVPERLAAEAGLPPTQPAAAPEAPAVQVPPAPPPPVEATVSAPPQPTAVPAVAPPPVQAKSLPPGQRYGVQNTASRITLRVHRPSIISVWGPNNRFYINRMLAPGDTYLVPNVVGLKLSAPDGGAVELILDGSSMGFAGRDGVNTNGLSLNPQDVIDRRSRG